MNSILLQSMTENGSIKRKKTLTENVGTYYHWENWEATTELRWKKVGIITKVLEQKWVERSIGGVQWRIVPDSH